MMNFFKNEVIVKVDFYGYDEAGRKIVDFAICTKEMAVLGIRKFEKNCKEKEIHNYFEENLGALLYKTKSYEDETFNPILKELVRLAYGKCKEREFVTTEDFLIRIFENGNNQKIGIAEVIEFLCDEDTQELIDEGLIKVSGLTPYDEMLISTSIAEKFVEKVYDDGQLYYDYLRTLKFEGENEKALTEKDSNDSQEAKRILENLLSKKEKLEKELKEINFMINILENVD